LRHSVFGGETVTLSELKQKALSLPLLPGVYLMKDAAGQVIYVGKAKKLKNRVSQYFQDSAAHTGKTRLMVSRVSDFDTIAAGSEFEALVLECSLIKRHAPRYNILLKDDKGYPYLRLDLREDYPRLRMVSRVEEDSAEYFGPVGGRFVTQKLMDAIRLALKLPDCSRSFPRDIGKDRPCLNYHMKNCDGWCRGELMQTDYRERILQAVQLLKGNYKQVAAELRGQMEQAAEELRFEEAAALRDRIKTLDNLCRKQLVTASGARHTDVIGFFANESKACFAVLHFAEGDLQDKDYEILPRPDSAEEAVGALVKQYYLSRGAAPREILLPVFMEDAPLLARLLEETYGKKIIIRTPQRGEGVQMIRLATENARQEAERITTREERAGETLRALGRLMGLTQPPQRLESFDISNTAGTDIVASMVVFSDGKPLKRDYRRFRLQNMEGQDDYGSMRQVIRRRFARGLDGDEKFSVFPDALLIDGGAVHAACAAEVLAELGISLPVFGMVKDDRHRTRGLVTPEGRELGIRGNPAVFALIGRIQEETHRFAVAYHHKLQSKRLRSSRLDEIPGIGKVRRELLIKTFRSVSGVEKASLEALRQALPDKTARAVYNYFHGEEPICE